MGVLHEIERDPDTMRNAFVWTRQVLDATAVEDLFTVQWSTPGSNHHRSELTTQTFFRDFLQDAEGMLFVIWRNTVRIIFQYQNGGNESRLAGSWKEGANSRKLFMTTQRLLIRRIVQSATVWP